MLEALQDLFIIYIYIYLHHDVNLGSVRVDDFYGGPGLVGYCAAGVGTGNRRPSGCDRR